MSLVLTQSLTAISLNLKSSFLGTGGTSPYVYSVVAGGVGGAIDASTGLYTAPAVLPFTPENFYDPTQLYDTIQVKDAVNATARAQIFVGTPLLLFCDILQTELGLDNNHIYLWDQKIFEPKDAGLYLAVKVLRPKPFGNSTQFNSDGTATQSVNMFADLQVSAISRGPEARDRKEEIILALNSIYSQQQQEANSFYVGKIASGDQFLNLSTPDGAAIPYRFDIMIALQYFVSKTKPVPYFDTFQNPPTVITEP